jgi:CRISPR-associated endonuclease/helicase Cas3
MRASSWPDWLEHIWAKSPEKGADGKSESLAQHTWDALCRLRDFAMLRQDLPQMLGAPRLWHQLYWAVYLHDWGKAAPGFQARLRGGEPWPHRHEVLSLSFLDWFDLDAHNPDSLWIAAGIVSHHRDAQEIRILYDEPDEDEDDQLAGQMEGISPDDLERLWRWAMIAPRWIEDLGLHALGVELLRLIPMSEAIARTRRAGPKGIYKRLRGYHRLARDLEFATAQQKLGLVLRGHVVMADHMASAHVQGMPTLDIDPQDILTSRKLTWDGLYEHQRQAHHTEGHTLLVAPTGSGKTEAALLWAASQMVATGDKPPRLFYTLPYQASMNAMQIRLKETFGEGKVGLQHGRAALALYRLLMEQNDCGPLEAVKQARFARSLAKLNYYPIRVFSPYQMLKAFYRLKGYEALLSDLSGGLFIFDEIHAYEPKRLAMILKSVEYLSEHYGARFFFMSATFPRLVREVLLEALGSSASVCASAELFAGFQRHRIELLDGEILDDASLDLIEADARQGRSVLVCCNLVHRAQEAYALLQERLHDCNARIELLHGGFNMRDRSRKEALVRNLGAHKESGRTFVLVATQVVEVSLDIDLDTLYTEPAPLEALVQRFGRINRRRKQKGLAPVHIFRLPDDGQYIYKPAALVKRTLELLERENGHAVDESQIGAWLDEIYAGELADAWRAEYDYGAREFEATCLQCLAPFAADESLQELFYRAFDGIDVLPHSLSEEYEELKEQDFVLAQELVASVRYGRLQQLRGAHLTWEPADGPIPIDVPYSSETGFNWNILRRADEGDDF